VVTKVIVLSGAICSGKSCLAKQLQEKLGAVVVRTRDLIAQRNPNVQLTTRAEFQSAGDELDRQDDGKWVTIGLLQRLHECDDTVPALVLDSVRIPEQLTELRARFHSLLTHVHLTAERQVLEERYSSRSSDLREFASYEKAREASETEANIEQLGELADVLIQTDRCDADDLFARVSARLSTRPGTASPCIDVIIGGQYGSEGKGNVVHFLAPEYDVLVRVGGPNAGHKVFPDSGTPYTFHQVPSGALANKNATLVLGAGAVISLPVLMKEISDLGITPGRLLIDPQAMIIQQEDIDWEADTLRDQIGSTASGVGHATARKINGRSLDTHPFLARETPELMPYLRDTVDFFADAIANGKRIMLEGTQGTSLSLHHGHYPHVTSRVTTVAGCLAEAGLSQRHVRKVIMVCRTLPIRVGNTDLGRTSGYMRQEIDLAEVARRSGIDLHDLQQAEKTSTTKRKRRIAEFDWAQFQRSIVLNGATDIALTFVDYINCNNKNAYRYEQLTPATLRFVEELEKVGGLPVSLISTAFSHRNIIDRRAWSNSRFL
jgi:adenylosuccinate synthase